MVSTNHYPAYSSQGVDHIDYHVARHCTPMPLWIFCTNGFNLEWIINNRERRPLTGPISHSGRTQKFSNLFNYSDWRNRLSTQIKTNARSGLTKLTLASVPRKRLKIIGYAFDLPRQFNQAWAGLEMGKQTLLTMWVHTTKEPPAPHVLLALGTKPRVSTDEKSQIIGFRIYETIAEELKRQNSWNSREN